MKKKVSKLAVLSLVTLFGITGCNNGSSDDKKDDDGKQDVEVKELKSISLSQSSVQLEEDAKQEVTLTIEQTGLKNNEVVVEWDTDNYEVATIVGVGLKRTIKAEGAGNAKLTVTATDTVNNKTLTAECAITVSAKDRTVHVSSVTLKDHEITLTMGSTTQKLLRATIAPENADNQQLTWSSSDEEVATVADGLVTAVAGSLTGRTATITVKSVDDPTKQDTCVVTVIDTFVAVEKVEISSEDTHFSSENGVNTLTLQSGVRTTGQLNARALGANNSLATNSAVTWSVEEGSDLVSVSSNGQVTVLKTIKYGEQSQSAKVRATSSDKTTVYADCTIVVEPDIERDETIHVEDNGIFFASTIPSKIEVGTTLNIQISFTNNTTYRDIEFEVVSNSATGTVGSKTGDYSYSISAGNTEGSFVLRAKSTDNENAVDEKTFTIYDTVTHVTSIDLGTLAQHEDENHPLVIFTDSEELNLGTNVSALPEQPLDSEHPIDRTLKYSTTSDCFSVTTAGVLSPVKVGRGRIMISSVQDPDVSKIIYVEVKGIVVKRIDVVHEKTLIVNDQDSNSFTLEPVVYNGRDGENDEKVTSTNVTYASSNPSVATVNAQGKVVAVSGGDAVITITSVENPSITATCNIKVLNYMPKVMTLSLPTNLTFFNSSKASATNSTEEMYARTSRPNLVFFENESAVYQVGNQGEFDFRPIVGALDDQGKADVNWAGEVEYNHTLYKDDVELSAAQAEQYVEFENTAMKFKSGVTGNFKVSYQALPSTKYKLSNTLNDIEFSFQVINGYNVYNLAQLSFFDNTNTHVNWTQYRADNHVEEAQVTDGLILHNDLTLNTEFFPQEIIWTKDEVDDYVKNNSKDFEDWLIATGYIGKDDTPTDEIKTKAKQALYNTPLDKTRIFSREFVGAYDKNFTFEGNLFAIDASAIKQVVRDGRGASDTLVKFVGGYGSEAQLFAINYEDNPASGKDVTFKNISMIGNGGVSNKDEIGINLAKGGLIGIKVSGVHFKTENMIMKSWFTGMQFEQHNEAQDNPLITSFDINKTIGTDFYNSAFYLWQAQNVKLRNSSFNGSSGPLILMDEVNRGGDWNAVNMRPVNGEAYNCYLDNEVSGGEPWFVNHSTETASATRMVQEMIAAQGKASGFIGYWAGLNSGKTITSTHDEKDFVNMLVIDINADQFGTNYYQNLNGKFAIYDEEGVGANKLGEIDMSKVAKDQVGYDRKVKWVGDEYISAKMIAISPNGGWGYIDESNNPHFSGVDFTQGDFMGYYMDPMLAMADMTVGYYVAALLKTY